MDNAGSFLERGERGNLEKKSYLTQEEIQFHPTDSGSTGNNSEMVAWNHILEKLKEKSNPQVFFWFKSLRPVHKDANSITLEAKSNFDKDWIENHYIDFINETIFEIYKRDFDIKIVSIQESSNTINLTKPKQKRVIRNRETIISGYVNPSYTFGNFIVGSSNQFAHAASYAVAQKPGRAYNPLFIYGGVGLGKTHLINAIGNYITTKDEEGNLNVCCISAENFTNQVIKGIRTNKMEEFRNRHRFGCDVLLIDDIQFIAGKESTQEEFFHTFNALYESKKQIVLTSDKSPHEMSYLEERLRSRFEWGLIADIQPPEIETRIAILTQKAEAEDIEFPNEVAMFVAQHTDSNIRELEGLLNNLVAYSKLVKQSITLDLAKQVLKTIIKKQESRVTTVESILREVANYFDLKLYDLKSNRKQKNIAIPRQIAMYLSRKYTVASFPDIGEKFGKDHSTIIHAVKKIESLLGKDIALTKSVSAISKKIDSASR